MKGVISEKSNMKAHGQDSWERFRLDVLGIGANVGEQETFEYNIFALLST